MENGRQQGGPNPTSLKVTPLPELLDNPELYELTLLIAEA